MTMTMLAVVVAATCLCGEAPERANDFFWENDRVGFRAYGPGDVHRWSGIDVFNKAVATNLVVHWLREPGKHGNWHLNRGGLGMDDYAVGPGRGVGGIAFRRDGKWLDDYGNWTKCRVLENGDARCAFELDYKLPFGGTMTLAISLERRSSLFREAVRFSSDTPLNGLEVGAGLDLSPAREHAGDCLADAAAGLVSLYEKPHNRLGEEGAMMSALLAAPCQALTLVDEPRGAKMLMTSPLTKSDAGREVLVVYAGADWSCAGRFKTSADWHRYVRAFRTPSVAYEDFGAVGDGRHDDRDAIVAAHAAANAKGVPVRAMDGATYYVGPGTNTAVVLTDVDFATAKIVIDDRAVTPERRNSPLFCIASAEREIALKGVKPLRRGQRNLGVTLPCRCLVRLENDKVRRYVRKGLNRNNGTAQQESVLVAADGTVDPATPVLWDYENVTKAMARPIDAKRLVVKGGVFVTRANRAPSRYTYYNRCFRIRRSNVEIAGLRHEITDETNHGAPYEAFLDIANCADVTVRDCVFTAHRTYWTDGHGGRVPMGSYDLNCGHAANISFVRCRQTTDIRNGSYWGLFGSNFCRNLLFDECSFSRFDAHMGVCGATVRNCDIGYMGLSSIGFGTFLVENTKIFADGFVRLRDDYGCTWDGDFVIRNCTYVPQSANGIAPVFAGRNDGTHDFGYVCHLPRKVTVDGLYIDDTRHPQNYDGPCLFGDITGDPKAKYAMRVTEEISLRNIHTASEKPLRPFARPAAFAATRVGPTQGRRAAGEIRVGTYNIRLQCGEPGTADCWDERRAALSGQIRKMDLDVFGLQEVCPGQMDYLRKDLLEFAFVGEHREKDRISGEASPVVYRRSRFDAEKSGTFWLSETPEIPASKSWGTCCTRVCSYLVLREKGSGRRFCFANTHTDHVSAEAREKGMMLIVERMKGFGAGCPIVFVGDHNCTEYEKPAQSVSAVLKNALYRSETPPQGCWRTWNGWRWKESEVSLAEALKLPVDVRNIANNDIDAAVAVEAQKATCAQAFYRRCSGPRIDYIYVSPDVRVRDYATHSDARPDCKMYPSDHFPVTATLILP